MDSTCSGFSMVSIGDGEQVSAEVAIDDAMKDVQEGLNNIHASIRLILMADERGDNFEETKEEYDRQYALIDEVTVLLKDLKKICKQIQPRKPRATTTKKKDEQKEDGFKVG